MTLAEARLFYLKYRGWDEADIIDDDCCNVIKIDEYEKLSISQYWENMWYTDQLKYQQSFKNSKVIKFNNQHSIQVTISQIKETCMKIWKYIAVNEYSISLRRCRKTFNIKVDRESVCMADDTVDHLIEYLNILDPIKPEVFLTKAWFKQLEYCSETNATFLTNISGEADWLISIKDAKAKELYYLAVMRIDIDKQLKELLINPNITKLNSKLMEDKIIYCKYIGNISKYKYIQVEEIN